MTLRPVERFTETQRKLPHMQQPGRTYFVTFKVRPDCGNMTPAAREIVLKACRFWGGRKCRVHACVVMPDHVHLLATPLPIGRGEACHNLSEMLHSIKSYSAKQINNVSGRTGRFWLSESFDRIIRTESDFVEKWNYIRSNPVRKELVDDPEQYPFLYEENDPPVQG